ncbi:uncharacterized protein LOC119729249 isoform X2 [Patiria miniata]|uniref:Uncharacterized protein n=1 Tax=Patiria miniata TaxID=46514 RepID=A0A914A309_PATMI|nr:uncharacterized protein LOC119729249 isoform X2 [Patiria miniata]
MSGLRRCMFVLHVAMVIFISNTHGQDSRFLGCFYDSVTNRVLPNLTSCNDVMGLCNNYCNSNVPYCQSSTNMSVTTCLGLCARKDFVYAGLQAGTQCFCGSRTARYDIHGEVRNEHLYLCRSNCSGDSTQNCGSDFRMRIFEIGCLPIDAPPNSTLSPANETFFETGRTLNISCQDGFFPTGPGSLTCLPAGQWNLPPPSCLPDVCDAPEPPNGTRPAERPSNGTRESSEYRGGDTLAFVCIDANVTINISCVEGEWQTDGVCQEIQLTTEFQLTNESTKVMTSMVTETSEDTSRSGMTTLMATDRPVQTKTMSPGFTEVQTEIVSPGFTAAVPTATVNSLVTEAVQTELVTSLFTEETTEQNRTNAPMATDAKEVTVASQAGVTNGNVTSTPWENMTTLTPPVGFPRERPTSMLWLIIIVGTALFLFVVVLFIALLVACRKKAKRDETINFQETSQIPRIDDMSQVNYAYEVEEMDSPNQNGRQTSGSPIRISTLYSQQEIMIENNNGGIHEYAKPVTPAYTTSQSGTVPNEYSSPVHHHAGNGEARTGPSVYFADFPEPDYDHARRESYVEVVTKL